MDQSGKNEAQCRYIYIYNIIYNIILKYPSVHKFTPGSEKFDNQVNLMCEKSKNYKF
jgi:hypothetical protein